MLYPFTLMATWFHEMSHGLMMIVTGVGFEKLEIFADSSGLAHGKGQAGPFARGLIACAGYMGTAIAGGLLIVMGRSARTTRISLACLGLALGLSALLWIANPFAWNAALIGMAFFLFVAALPHTWFSDVTLSLIGAQACMHALLDVRVLFRSDLIINGRRVSDSDAHAMAKASFGGPRLWAVVWLCFCVLVWFIALKQLRKSQEDSSARDRRGLRQIGLLRTLSTTAFLQTVSVPGQGRQGLRSCRPRSFLGFC